MRRRTVGSETVKLLAEHGIEVVFGICGVHTLEFFRGIEMHGLRHVPSRHEQGAVFAADGYARSTGRVGVAMLIGGPGLTNAATAIAQAYHDSIPLLVVSAATPLERLGRGRGSLHELPDQPGLMRTLTARSTHVDDPADLPEALAWTFSFFGSGRPRPVHIEMSADLISLACQELSARSTTSRRPVAPRASVDRASEILRSAVRPITIVGGGGVDATGPLSDVIEAVGSPVASTLNGKGVIAHDHPLNLGATLPTEAVIAEIEASDVALLVGTELSSVDLYYAPRPLRLPTQTVKIDIDSQQLNLGNVAVAGVHGDASEVLRAMGERLGSSCSDDSARQRVAELRRTLRWWHGAADFGPAVQAVQAALPRDAIVAVDSNQLGYVGQQQWAAWQPRSWLIPSGWGTLGPSLPMAIGAAVAHPDRPCVCVVGDGGLLFTVQELSAAAELGVNVTVLVWNNDGYAEMRDAMAAQEIPALGTAAPVGDWPALARALGVSADRANTVEELERQLVDGIATGGPTLIEARAEMLK